MGHLEQTRCLLRNSREKEERKKDTPPSPRNVSAILISDGGSEEGSGTLPHCSPDRNSEVTTGQKAGALRIHGALRGLQWPPLHPALEWLLGRRQGGHWRARYCHTPSFRTPRKPGTMKPPAGEEHMLPFL